MISERQNEPISLQRLAAQRQIYARAKKFQGIQLLLIVPLVVVMSLLAGVFPLLTDASILCSLSAAVLDLALAESLKRMKVTAANIQEEFDCHVLQLPWSTRKDQKRPSDETVVRWQRAYDRARKSTDGPLTDWYPSAADGLPIELGRLVCQRANLSWDSEQRRRYAWAALVAGIVSVTLTTIAAFFGDVLVRTMITRIVSPMLPILLIVIRQAKENFEASSSQEHVKDELIRVWENALSSSQLTSELERESRDLQNEIYDGRRRGPLVPDYIFNRWRREQQQVMDTTAGQLVEAARARLHL